MSDADSPAAPRRAAGAFLGIALLLACGAGGFLAYRLTRPVQPLLYPSPAAGTPAATAAPLAPEPPVGRRIPDQLPPISLPDLQGVKHSLADYRGKLLLVNFWATWCDPCRREIPLLMALRRERAKDGLEIVGIAVDYRDDVANYAVAKAIGYPLMIGEQGGLAAANALGMDMVLPFSVFADRSGRILTLKVGELHADEARLILDRLADVDRGRLSEPTAREQIAAGIARLNAARAYQAVPQD